jgi:hypothetical protein
LSLTEGSTEQPKTSKQMKLYTIRFWIQTKQFNTVPLTRVPKEQRKE